MECIHGKLEVTSIGTQMSGELSRRFRLCNGGQ